MIDVFLNKTLHLRAISRCHVSVLQAIPEKKYVLKNITASLMFKIMAGSAQHIYMFITAGVFPKIDPAINPETATGSPCLLPTAQESR